MTVKINSMLYTTKFCTVKNPDWKVVSVTGADGTELTEASVNRVNKKGEVFPGFDDIQAGRTFQAEPWQSSKGVWYLFAPRTPKTAPQRPFTPKTTVATQVAKAQENKAQMIENFQETKQEAIQRSAAQRDAVLMTTTFYPEFKELVANKDEIIRDKFMEWMKYFLGKADEPFV